MPYWKPESPAALQGRRRRHRTIARRACREAVYDRDGMRCRGCGQVLERPEATDVWWRIGHVHEILSRSQGGSATDPANCVLLCPTCHLPHGAHGNRPRIEALSAAVAYGWVRLTFRTGRIMESRPPAPGVAWLRTVRCEG